MKVSSINFMDFTSVSHVHYLSHFEFQYLTVLQQDQFCALSLLTGFDSGITRLFLKVDETLSKSFFLLESSSALFSCFYPFHVWCHFVCSNLYQTLCNTSFIKVFILNGFL